MIVQGTKIQHIDVEIDPVKFITDFIDSWKILRKIPCDAEMIGGSWMTYERQGHTSDWVVSRHATKEELSELKALNDVLNIAHELE